MTRMIANKTPGWEDTEVFVDGIKIDRCFEASDDLGKAWIYDETALEGYKVLKGKVEFRKKTAPPNNTNTLTYSVDSNKMQEYYENWRKLGLI